MKRDRIENAIRHIQTATDVDPWAAELAVEALKAQLSEEDTTSDCISRQAAIEAAIEGADEWGGGYSDSRDEAITNAIDKVPSVQTNIIRCKDCKYWDTTWESDYAPNYHFCPMLGMMREGDFYCADAERRADG